jgi:hypothetical protein
VADLLELGLAAAAEAASSIDHAGRLGAPVVCLDRGGRCALGLHWNLPLNDSPHASTFYGSESAMFGSKWRTI